MLSDSDLICAVQSDDAHTQDEARKELMDRFGSFLHVLAGQACLLAGLNVDQHREDVVDLAVVDLLDPDKAKFDPARPDASPKSYLRGLIQNAARTHGRFVRRGATVRHDYSHPENDNQHLPESPVAIPDPFDAYADIDDSGVVAAALTLASPRLRLAIYRFYWCGETMEQAAGSAGVSRSTISRDLASFYEKARVALGPLN
jgi:RNA polymerase sigma factor (sigma-70 family)